MVSAQLIQAEIRKYVGGTIAFDVFEDWVISQSWNTKRDDDPDAYDLFSRIELALAEFSNEHLTRDELVMTLNSLAQPRQAEVHAIRAENASASFQGVSLERFTSIDLVRAA